ncbi:DNA repair protein RecN [Sphingobacterium psychroaquaticum]|uniref:DNA repair protein RecN n=1 Tax=Sphingobacterium psychroaquaticum TaxID=561061 RepID=A0A1X7IWQ4_9SPHI|nr:DNA repair protein RecN [Sphingobacterium psychroaquaticum]SMG19666.1 DNA repair protein RecN (Recombination protein N) [Sphingobacterium psychroaquaticum]
MLRKLSVKNYALIENLDIAFHEGLNILTGETGAGKSIIMGALGLILGNRVEGRPFFDEQRKCIIEGYFQIESYGLADFFVEHDLDYEAETIIRREIAVDGKSRAFVNDSPVTLQVLKLLGEQLIDIHSQHATLQINTESFQLLVLDSVAKNQQLLQGYAEGLGQYRRDEQALKKLKEEIAAASLEQDFNQFLHDELEQANLQAGEQELLEEEQGQLENAEEIKRGLLSAVYLLDEQEQAVVQNLRDAQQQLQNVQRFLPAGNDLANRLQSSLIEIKDIVQEIGFMEQGVGMDQARLDFVNERLSTLYSLQKKHRVENLSALIELQDSLARKLEVTANQEQELAKQEKIVRESLTNLMELATRLHASREAVLPTVVSHVEAVLSEVGMPNAQLKIELHPLAVERFKSQGADEVQFLFSANKGQALQPIHKVASGGELSRVMLAIKSLVAQRSALPTIIFDEIDTGISGEVALKVGEIMERLSERMQVLAITHLPQIASKGQAHFKVYKQDEGERTKSNILRLDPSERIYEVAQMLSGASPGAAALEHAKQLIED